ncbi:hypothetical protein SAMN04488563_4097 [Jiangella alkaliphila]|uniref:Uncharacterized protein n=2 Tax=Jiangella alkaliphila TaxID=419479 RepID=A0A1H2KPV7_9ACTN|nr:hypothetical protein SAMN04488563_4097 [Jiangella alkaliphila]
MSEDQPSSITGGERTVSAVTVDDLRHFGAVFEDLADPDVMSRAWT